jgi:SAM-dependent methyltransferase
LSGRHSDGSAGDANYGAIGAGYARYRRPDPRIAAAISLALGGAHTVLNVGAGAGSYEPAGRLVTAVEPSESMRQQRASHLPPAVDAVADDLPFGDGQFDAAMATFTVHQWPDLNAGLAEIRRVTTGPIVIMTCDPDELSRFWLDAYAPEVLAVEASRYPHIEILAAALGRATEIIPVPIPFDCSDGFNEAYYGRPERLLDPGARLACSAWSFVAPSVESRFVAHLGSDLESGAWDTKYGALRSRKWFEGSLKLVVGHR